MPNIYRQLNAIGLLAVTAILGFAFIAQFVDHELPCPLCLLQRVGFVGVMAGLFMNVSLGNKPVHYSLATLAAIFGAVAALRQTSLHVLPGTPAYGSDFFSLHFYTWAFICFMIIIFGLAIVSACRAQYDNIEGFIPFKQQSTLAKIALIAAVAVVLLNALATFAECGPLQCPDNPIQYWLFNL
ncbi:disulfide bond formation protein DsbB [Sinobacterium caligoides]|uniref:Disulfide bond formation protein DsbB n=1 Tax=Sinobacterium caligoides TaxID=933926 RepID=A0A3N2E004_9GAMM|nr:disulfide bond formation protein B [Sinobacterium caligoides]ROS05443.1 disulfide bond formation protein DsbB [Sinobacterium caligoides]